MTILDQIIAVLDKNVLPAVTSVIIAIEIIGRLIKTDTPWSILWIIQKVCFKLSVILAKVAEFLDKVLPQRLK